MEKSSLSGVGEAVVKAALAALVVLDPKGGYLLIV
jgi:hypothetical protein